MLTYDPGPEGVAVTLRGLFHEFDRKRYEYLAAALEEEGRPHLAELARRWASEHAEMARRERDAAAPAVDLDVLTSLQGDAR